MAKYNRRHDHGQVYAFIVRYKQRHDGNAPSIRTIGEACGITSTSVVRSALKKLIREGRIRSDPDTQKIEVVGAEWRPPAEIVQN